MLVSGKKRVQINCLLGAFNLRFNLKQINNGRVSFEDSYSQLSSMPTEGLREANEVIMSFLNRKRIEALAASYLLLS